MIWVFFFCIWRKKSYFASFTAIYQLIYNMSTASTPPTTNNTKLETSLLTKAKRVLYALFLLIIAPIYMYLSLPVMNFWFFSFPLGLLMISCFIGVFEIGMTKGKSTIIFKIAATVFALSALHIVITSVASWALFRSASYRELIGVVKESESGNFSKDIAPVSLEQVRIIDQEVAHRLGDKVLGEQPSLGSQVEVGTFNIQTIKGQLYWVAPLLHDGFFKWWNKSGGTPAYIRVSATNERDVQLINAVGGKPVYIKYQPNAFFGSNLQRHLYFSGYATTGTTDYTFEVDDEGHPYWVVSLYTNQVGFMGDNVYGIAVVNAETGEIKEYNPTDAPAWVDRIQPKEMVETQLNDWGKYVNGYINLSNEGKLQTTEGISLVYGEDGRSYWYTGLTSVGRDAGTVGFVLVDTRTKTTTWYKQAGATEEAAMQSAKGKVQEKGFTASFPILYNINGVPTYVMSLKDKAGLVKMIALVSVEDYAIVGVGNNIKEAVRAYKEAYNGSSPNNNLNLTANSTTFQLRTRVQRMATDIIGGSAFYYIYCDSPSDKIFIGSSSVSNELPLTQVGDSVLIMYSDGRTPSIDLTNFDNLSIQLKTTTEQELKPN
jgi:hypothetical protein